MDEPPNSNLNVVNLLYPELLSREELIQILLSRCVQSHLLEGLEKNQLVDLFQRIVLPLPQRVNKNNRRGKMLNSLIKSTESRIKNGDSDIHSENRSFTPSHITSSKTASSHGNRDANKSSNSLDHIIINDRRKKPKVEESQDVVEKQPKISVVESKSNPVIKLKRTVSSSSESSSAGSRGEEDDKKKKRRIVWP